MRVSRFLRSGAYIAIHVPFPGSCGGGGACGACRHAAVNLLSDGHNCTPAKQVAEVEMGVRMTCIWDCGNMRNEPGQGTISPTFLAESKKVSERDPHHVFKIFLKIGSFQDLPQKREVRSWKIREVGRCWKILKYFELRLLKRYIM